MSFNGSGTFVVNTAGQPVVPNTVISATAFNALTADLANGLSTCITKDGQTTPTANIPMGNNKITGLAAGTAGTDAANLSQVQGSTAKLLQSVTGTDTITAAMVPALTAYAAGQMFYFVAAGDNTGAVTINIDSLGAKSVTRDGSTALVAGDITNGKVVVIVYDGTRFQLLNSNAFTNLYVSGNLGVGTASPAYRLHVVQNANDYAARITQSNAGGSSGGLYIQQTNGGTNGLLVDTTGAYGNCAVFNGGNVGIGTASPGYRLDVRGTSTDLFQVKSTGAYTFSRFQSSSRNWALSIGSGFSIYDETAAASRLDIDSSGNLGIGTSSPSCRLDVRGQETTNYNTARFLNGIDNQGLDVLCGRALTNGTVAGVASSLVMTLRSSGSVAGVLAFATGNDERGRFDQNGNLGIGTTSPGSRLHVDAPTNTVQIRAGDGNVLTYAAYSSGVSTNALNYYGTASNHDLGFLTNNAERARITKTGNIVAGASVALATTATDGFLYVPTCAGTPTGTPTAITGMAPIVVNTTNNKLYFYSGGAWRDAGP